MKNVASYSGLRVAKCTVRPRCFFAFVSTFLSLSRSQDDLIQREKASYAISGGCCALAAIHLMGKLYVANAGDSR